MSCFDGDLFDWYAEMAALRNRLEPLRTGGFSVLHADGDVLVFERRSDSGSVVVAINRGDVPANVKLYGETWTVGALQGLVRVP
jgi:glycosidase